MIDLIDVGPELVQAPEGGLAAGLRYFGLRLPIMLSELMPLTALLAGLLAVADLLRHRELVVIWSIGVRPPRILKMLLPAGLALVAVKFAVDDLAVPRATTQLRLWGIGEYRHRPGEAESGGLLLAAQRRRHREAVGGRGRGGRGARHLDLPPRSRTAS